MRTGDGTAPAYNVQTAVDAEHALIVVQKVTRESNDTRSLQPMAEAAAVAVCASHGILPHVPSNRDLIKQVDGTFVDRPAFQFQEQSDTGVCPAGQPLR